MSLASVLALYDGWLTIRADPWETPPAVRLLVPTTLTVLAVVRPMVQ